MSVIDNGAIRAASHPIILPDELLYGPFEAGPFRMSMGLVARDPDEKISLDRHYPVEIEQRRALLARWGSEVTAAQPGAEPEPSGPVRPSGTLFCTMSLSTAANA